MVEILPFYGLGYNRAKIKDFSKIIAPPYDIISESQKEKLKNLNPLNIVRLILPDETGVVNKYQRAGQVLDCWLKDETLTFDDSESFYLFEESFMENGLKKSFTGFIGLLKIEEYGTGKVLRHEKTLSKPKEDRLNLLTACRTNFEFIYTVYNDDDGNISALLDKQKNKTAEIETSAFYDSSLGFKLWKICNMDLISALTVLMKPKSLLIADGHHRYETSRLYRETVLKNNGKKSINEPGSKPEDFILALFVSTSQENISIHPTHRIIKFSKELTGSALVKMVGDYFEIENIECAEQVIDNLMSNSLESGKKSFCVCLEDKSCYSLTLKHDLKSLYESLSMLSGTFDMQFEYLDVNILHKFILLKLLGRYGQEDIKFVHTIKEVFETLNLYDKYTGQIAGFILNPPDIKTVEKLSVNGLVMPQKSTYFYPKPCSGLIMYKFDMV